MQHDSVRSLQKSVATDKGCIDEDAMYLRKFPGPETGRPLGFEGSLCCTDSTKLGRSGLQPQENELRKLAAQKKTRGVGIPAGSLLQAGELLGRGCDSPVASLLTHRKEDEKMNAEVKSLV